MRQYNLGFIADADIFQHVRNTVLQYRMSINLREFNSNIIDPIKMTFDAKIYGQTIRQAIEAECIRQIDKSNSNRIGYFHQYIFKYAGDGWEVPDNGEQGGFDVVNNKKHIFVEMKNKHNTMNSASASSTYIKMQSKLLQDDKATCLLVEAIAKKSQDMVWRVTVEQNSRKTRYAHERIRRMSMDKFYALVFGDPLAFHKLCTALPVILDDVLEEMPEARLVNTVYDELGTDDFQRNIYMLAFATYEGFNTEKQ